MNFKGSISIILIVILITSIGCTSKKDIKDKKVLVYGSSNYISINPVLYEHGKIKPHFGRMGKSF